MWVIVAPISSMTKGISSRNSLKALAFPIQKFLSGWGAQTKPGHALGPGSALPSPYELAALRGEAVLRERFFKHFMGKLPVTLDADRGPLAFSAILDVSRSATGEASQGMTS